MKNCQWSVNILPIYPTRRRIFLFWSVNFLFFFRRLNTYFPVYLLIISGLILMVVKRKKMSFIYWNITKTHFSWIYLMCFFFLSLMKFYSFPYFVKVLKTDILKYIQKYKNMCQRWWARIRKKKITFHKVVDQKYNNKKQITKKELIS